MSKREFIRYSQMINNGKFRLLAVAMDSIQMDGFTVKPGMMIYQATNKGHRDIFFVAYPGPSPMYIHGWMFLESSVKGAMLRKSQFEDIEDASEEARSILDKVAYLSACKEADRRDPESLATLDHEVQLTFQPGEVYGTCITSLKPTEHPGVFWRTMCSVLTDYDGGEYAVYTQAELDSAIEASEAIKAVGSLYGGCDDDYDEYYYYDDDDE